MRFSQRLAVVLLCLISTLTQAAGKEAIDAKVQEALAAFVEESPSGAKLMEQAIGVLVFPNMIKMSFGPGGEYGEGAMLVDGEPLAYYSTAREKIGFPKGASFKAQIVLFMTKQSYASFRGKKGWKPGVDGRIAYASLDGTGKVKPNIKQEPLIGFVFTDLGMMADETMHGFKFVGISRR